MTSFWSHFAEVGTDTLALCAGWIGIGPNPEKALITRMISALGVALSSVTKIL